MTSVAQIIMYSINQKRGAIKAFSFLRFFCSFLYLASWADEPVWFKETKCGKNEFGPYLKIMCEEAQTTGHFTDQGIGRSASSMVTNKGVQVIIFSYVLSNSLSTLYNFYF